MHTTDDLVKLVETEVAKFKAEISSLNDQLDEKDIKIRRLSDLLNRARLRRSLVEMKDRDA